ncbi:MAG: phage terminase large subunit family protein [Selenomonadaceae bacterium]|nr:phage terminase large subunit family protein [Selenomonadaceae bacterium]
MYFKQLIAEHHVVKWTGGTAHQAWEPIYKGVRNEALDLRCYNICAIKSLRVDWNNFPTAEKLVEKPKKSFKPVSVGKILSL